MDAFVVGVGGRLEPNKGHEQMARAARMLLSEVPNVHVVVMGAGVMQSHYEALRKAGAAVHIVGKISGEDLAGFYNSLDVFIDPFLHHHGINTVMLEAVLSGVPLVSTRLPTSLTTTSPVAHFGVQFDLGDPRQLAEVLKALRKDPRARDVIGRNGAWRARMLFTSQVCAQAYEALFYRAITTPSHNRPLTGQISCQTAYPAMCFRLPS
jgi:glycosyltransferase involved in cell wall biosynthesis